MNQPLQILLLEDSDADAELIKRILNKAIKSYSYRIATNKNEFLQALETYVPDLIISDNSLPQFDASDALRIVRVKFPQIPFILVTGTVSEDFAAEIINKGADDYILKDRMMRLPAAIDAAIVKRRILKEVSDYKYAIDQSAIVSITDRHGIILYVNDNLCRISKFTPAELIGADHRIMNAGSHTPEFISNLWDTISGGRIWHQEMQNRASDGSLFWLDTFIIPFLDDKKKPYQYLAIRTDITERKKIESQLQAAHERLELVITATNDVIWDWDLTNDSIIWNHNYFTHFGFNEQAARADLKSWERHVHPDDRQRVLDGIHRCFENQAISWKDEYRFIKESGEIAFILDCGFILYTTEGIAYRMVGAMLDITEQKKSGELLKQSLKEKEALAERTATILDTLPANIAVLDKYGYIREVNAAWKDFADANDYSGKQYGIGDNYLEISRSVGQKDVSGSIVSDGILAVLDDKLPEFVYEYPCHSPTDERWFRMVVTPLRGVNNGGVVVMHVDISELKRLEKERMKEKMDEQKKIARAILHGQEKERSAIAGELHDNVNQILAATNLFLSIAKTNPEKTIEYIISSMENIHEAIEENRRIAHELIAPNFRQMPLIELISNLAETMLKTASLSVTMDTNELEEESLTEEQKLAVYRVAQEQCTNIIKYARASEVKIKLMTTDALVWMSIADNGKGMDFGKKSEGIGLRNIHGRLSILNGSARIETAPDKGFVLTISFPR